MTKLNKSMSIYNLSNLQIELLNEYTVNYIKIHFMSKLTTYAFFSFFVKLMKLRLVLNIDKIILHLA